MQEGMGRAGYRVLAALLLAAGLAGLAAVLYGYGAGAQGTHFLGFALAAVALAGLFVLLALVLASPRGAPRPPVPAPPRPADAGLPAGGIPGVPVIDLTEDPEPVLADAPWTSEPGPAEPVPVQPNRNLTLDTKGWPGRKPPSGVTRGEARARSAPAAPRARAKPRGEPLFEEVERTAVPLAPPRKAASARAPSEPPTVLARETTARGAVPAGMAKGQCGTCEAYLLAPAVRPLKLRCPSCSKVTTLQ